MSTTIDRRTGTINRAVTIERADTEQRIIVARLCSYDTPYDVSDWLGRYTETIVAGAFDEALANRAHRNVKLLRDHQSARAIGRMIEYRSTSTELEGTFRVSSTPLGDESLELARDGVLDVSIGAELVEGGTWWNDDFTECRHEELRLRETSLVPLPAYDDATVLSTRSRVPPRRAEILAWLEAHK